MCIHVCPCLSVCACMSLCVSVCLCLCVCASVCVKVHVNSCAFGTQNRAFSGVGVTGGCEPLDTGAGNRTQVSHRNGLLS